MDPKVDKLVRRTTMVATVTASYFLLTSDYGPEPNILDPVRFAGYDGLVIKRAIQSAEGSVKKFINEFGKEPEQNHSEEPTSNHTKYEP
ncbi:hypothetical protein Syun_013133 [Stephania yunnanensis]|uniref:Uncharacterized protein n=1 Tax=Stephania yunnanensis TaxID=152371 RepID=A0AAP0K273_9MAGN